MPLSNILLKTSEGYANPSVKFIFPSDIFIEHIWKSGLEKPMIYFFKWKLTAYERHRFNGSCGQSLHPTDRCIVSLSSSGVPSSPSALVFSQYALLFLVTGGVALHKSFSYLVIFFISLLDWRWCSLKVKNLQLPFVVLSSNYFLLLNSICRFKYKN